MIARRALLGRLVLAPVVLLLAACGQPPTATPLPPAPTQIDATALPATPTAPVATSVPSPSPSPRSTATPDERWQTVEQEAFSMRVPAPWQILDLSGESAASLADQFAADSPFLSGIAGPSEELRGAELAAVGPEDAGFAPNLTVRRSPLGAERVTDLQRQVVDPVMSQYGKLGFEPNEGRADLRTDGGLRAAEVTYTLPASGSIPGLRGHQHFVATDGDLWILTYTFADGSDEPAFVEESFASFLPR